MLDNEKVFGRTDYIAKMKNEDKAGAILEGFYYYFLFSSFFPSSSSLSGFSDGLGLRLENEMR